MCRRSHGAGYVTWIGIPIERLDIEQGEKELVAFRSSDHGTRRFCGICGSTLFCDSTHHPEYTDIVLANLGIRPVVGQFQLVGQAEFLT